MLNQELIVKSVVDSVTEVFEMMLGMETKFEGEVTDAQKSESGLISLVGITGEWGGSGVFCCSPEFANKLCVGMLGGTVESNKATINDEVLDVVAEMTNMMIGNVKNHLEPVTGPLAISVPTVIHGRNFQFKNIAGLRGSALYFSQGSGTFEVRVALAPAPENKQSVRSKIPILGLAAL